MGDAHALVHTWADEQTLGETWCDAHALGDTLGDAHAHVSLSVSASPPVSPSA